MNALGSKPGFTVYNLNNVDGSFCNVHINIAICALVALRFHHLLSYGSNFMKRCVIKLGLFTMPSGVVQKKNKILKNYEKKL